MFSKCVEIVKAFRSHPSVIEYCVQNEIGADLTNPDTIAVLDHNAHEDPCRCIVVNDGLSRHPARPRRRGSSRGMQAPRSDEEESGEWWNQHQGAGDQWYDEFYKGPHGFHVQPRTGTSSRSSAR